jgi:hypothetical protein
MNRYFVETPEGVTLSEGFSRDEAKEQARELCLTYGALDVWTVHGDGRRTHVTRTVAVPAPAEEEV